MPFNFFLIFFSCHGHDLLQILKIKQIIGFVVHYLYQGLLVYPKEFLPLQGSHRMVLRKFILKEKNYSSVWSSTDITRWDPLT